MRYAEREVFASLPVPPVAIIGTQFAFKTLHLQLYYVWYS